MNLPTPPKTSDRPFTTCSAISGMPMKKFIKPRKSSYNVLYAVSHTEDMTSTTETARPLKEFKIEGITEQGRSSFNVYYIREGEMRTFWDM